MPSIIFYYDVIKKTNKFSSKSLMIKLMKQFNLNMSLCICKCIRFIMQSESTEMEK